MRHLYGHRCRVSGLAFSPAGNTLASGGADGQLRIWDLSRGRTLRTITGHTGAVNTVAFLPDGERLASAGDDGVVRIWANPVVHAATNLNGGSMKPRFKQNPINVVAAQPCRAAS